MDQPTKPAADLSAMMLQLLGGAVSDEGRIRAMQLFPRKPPCKLTPAALQTAHVGTLMGDAESFRTMMQQNILTATYDRPLASEGR